MEAVGGRPGDGEEIEAVLRRFFGSRPEALAGITVGKLRDFAELVDAESTKVPWELLDIETRVKRVGVVHVDGDGATAEFSASGAPTRGPAGMVPLAEVTTFEQPRLVRTEDGWKLSDYYADGVLARESMARVDGCKTSRGITVELLLARWRRRYRAVHLRITNAREHPVWLAEAGAYRPPVRLHSGRASRWATVAPQESEVVTFSWSGRLRPFGSTVRLYLPFYDVGQGRWVRVGVAGMIES